MTRCQKDNINLKVQIVIKNTNIICAQPILSTIIHMIMMHLYSQKNFPSIHSKY